MLWCCFRRGVPNACNSKVFVSDTWDVPRHKHSKVFSCMPRRFNWDDCPKCKLRLCNLRKNWFPRCWLHSFPWRLRLSPHWPLNRKRCRGWGGGGVDALSYRRWKSHAWLGIAKLSRDLRPTKTLKTEFWVHPRVMSKWPPFALTNRKSHKLR
jgi:hypothetical protein